MDLFKENLDERGVLTVTFNRPEVHNAFNDAFISSLTKAVDKWEEDSKVQLVVLRGEGKSFCAGADLNWMKRMKDYSEQENYEDSKRLNLMFKALNEFSKPLLSVVHGAVLGGGTGMVAVSDYVLAEESTKFGFTEVRLGLVPAVISPYVINKIGESAARAFFLSGSKFDANKALNMHLIHQVCNEGELNEATDKVIGEFLKAAPHAQKEAKCLIDGVLEIGPEHDPVYEYTCGLIAKLRISDEGQEGMSALLEKRKPKWLEK